MKMQNQDINNETKIGNSYKICTIAHLIIISGFLKINLNTTVNTLTM